LFGNHRCNCWQLSQAWQSSLVLNSARPMAFELLMIRLIISGEIPLYLPAASAQMASPPASAHRP
jgi:hypothetical protein